MAKKQQNYEDDTVVPSLGGFDVDDFAFAASTQFLPQNASADATYSFEDAPVYRDLAGARSVSYAVDSLKFVLEPVRVHSCYSEPPRPTKALPPAVPEMFVLEKSHLVLKDVPLERALDEVMERLKDVSSIDSSIQCDCEVVRKDFKIRGMVRSGFDSVDFRVNVFRSRTDGQIALPLVEFQRRCGDLFLFRRFFSSVSAALSGENPPVYGLGRVPQIMMDLGDDELELEDEIEPLATLLDSEYVDMQLEGVRAVGQVISQTSPDKLTAALPKLMKSILRIVTSTDRELRCSVVCLIATTCTMLQQQNTAEAEKLMAEFAAPIVRALHNVRLSYATAHTQRECLRVLSTVSQNRSCGEQIVLAGGEAVLQQCRWNADETNNSFADSALRNLVAGRC